MSKTNIADILFELEAVLDKMADEGLQKGEILALVNVYLDIHRPDCKEVYTEDGSSPRYFYGYDRP